MKFTPNYTVSYHGAFHPAGVSFEIDPEDAAELVRHGQVEEPAEAGEPVKKTGSRK